MADGKASTLHSPSTPIHSHAFFPLEEVTKESITFPDIPLNKIKMKTNKRERKKRKKKRAVNSNSRLHETLLNDITKPKTKNKKNKRGGGGGGGGEGGRGQS